MNKTNTTTSAARDAGQITSAKTLSFDPATGALYADGINVGGASDLSRDEMLRRLTAPQDHAEDSDETLFDLVVETL